MKKNGRKYNQPRVKKTENVLEVVVPQYFSVVETIQLNQKESKLQYCLNVLITL